MFTVLTFGLALIVLTAFGASYFAYTLERSEGIDDD